MDDISLSTHLRWRFRLRLTALVYRFFLELLGNLTALMLGRTMFVFIFEFIWTFLVAYILYWLVVHAVSE